MNRTTLTKTYSKARVLRGVVFFALSASATSLLTIGDNSFAQMPPQNVAPGRHPYLAQAQYFIAQANQAILSAQQSHAYHLNGHAENARRLLDEANAEVKAAALTANGP